MKDEVITVNATKYAEWAANKWFDKEYEQIHTFRALHEQVDETKEWKLKDKYREILDAKIKEIELQLSNFMI